MVTHEFAPAYSAAPAYRAAPTTTMQAAPPDLTSLSALIFTLLGSIIMAVVGVRMFTAYTKKAWGELITELVAIVFVGWFVWFPDSAKATITVIIHQVFG